MAQPQPTNNVPDNQMESLKTYGGYIVTAILLALAGYFGWTYWQNNHAKVDTVAADQYADIQQLNGEVSLAAQNPDLEADAQKVLADKQALLDKDIKALVATHGDTVYAWQALLIQARQQADANDFKGASATLKQALDINLEDAGLKGLTVLRYAQVQLADGDAKGALATLSQELPGSFEASKQELLGDIHMAQGDKAAATQAYNNAWEQLRERQENRAVLALKMESLGITPDPIEGPASLVNAPAASENEAIAAPITADEAAVASIENEAASATAN
jgi:predicted negative regulator of RcsB-dependent stress response